MAEIRQAPSTFKDIVPQLIAVIGPYLVTVHIGAGAGYSGVALPSLRNDTQFSPTADEETWVASIFSLGLMFGPILNSLMNHFLGLKHSLTVGSAFAALGWLLIAVAQNIPWIYAGRVINGIAVGTVVGFYTVYVTEVTDSKTRGLLLTISAGLVAFGSLTMAILGTFISWRHMAIFGVCVSLLASICTAFLSPEPPERLLRKGKKTEALRSLSKLYKIKEDAQEKMLELEEKYTNQNNENNINIISAIPELFRSFFSARCLKPLTIMSILFFIQQFSGMPPIVFYSVDLLHSVSSGVLDAHYLNIIVTAYRMILTFITATVIGKFGNRKILIFTGFGMTLPMLALGGVSLWEKSMNQDQIPDYMKWLSIVLVTLFITFNALGIGTIPWVILGAMFPSDIRVFASGISVIVSVFFIFLCVFTYPFMLVSMNSYGTYFLFGVVCFIGSIFFTIFVPETQGKNLDDIEKHFEGNEM